MLDSTDLQQIPAFEPPLYSDIRPPVFDGDLESDPLEAAERRRASGPVTARRNATADRSSNFDERPIELVLYVSSISPHSRTALRNIRRALAQFANRPFSLTVHDLSKDPQRAARDGVTFTPTLVSGGQGPRTWILGHLQNPQVLREFLESALEQLRP